MTIKTVPMSNTTQIITIIDDHLLYLNN